MVKRTEHIVSDLSVASPANALSETPMQDRWIVIPYEGEVSGKMLWSPVRHSPPPVSIRLPDLGLCDIHIGIYGSGTVPIWFNLIAGRKGGSKAYNHLKLRFSDEDWFDTMVPEDYPDQPRFTYISESFWRTADVSGKSIVFARETKEAYQDTTILVAYIRLVPVETKPEWPRGTKRLSAYMDSNFVGHYVDSVADIKSHIAPLREGDFDALFWTTCREDNCYYPTKIGNPMPADTPRGVYPYWAGRDMKRMLDRGEDPLRVVCDVAHDCGLKLFASYRRMTCRMPPFVFPLHPNAMFPRRRDLWCAGPKGETVPHFSLAFPEVRRRMVSLFREQAENYDIDGVHMFFCRGMPFVFFEKPFLDAFQEEYGADARALPVMDERVWRIRAKFFLQYMRELRAALDEAGKKRGRRLEIAMHAVNSLRANAYYGIDVPAMAREGLIDLFIPGTGHFLPPEFTERHCSPQIAREFVEAVKGTGARIRPAWEEYYWGEEMTLAQRVNAYYEAGVDGLHAPAGKASRPGREFAHRLGHVGHIEEAEAAQKRAARMVLINKFGGFPFDMVTGIPTVG